MQDELIKIATEFIEELKKLEGDLNKRCINSIIDNIRIAGIPTIGGFDIVLRCFKEKISDIHIEKRKKELKLYCRIQGKTKEVKKNSEEYQIIKNIITKSSLYKNSKRIKIKNNLKTF